MQHLPLVFVVPALMAILAWIGTVPAGIPQPSSEVPETAVGQDLQHVLDAFGEAATELDGAKFSDAFKAQVPIEQLQAVPAMVRAQLGALQLMSVTEGDTPASLVAVCTGAKNGSHVRIFINHNDDGLIEGLLIQPAPDLDGPKITTWDEFTKACDDIPGDASIGVYEVDQNPKSEPTVIASLNPDLQLAIGSTFKLYVLRALVDMIDAGETAWDAELAIKEAWKSLPSGTMQHAPAGSTFPIAEFATKMISISDNTATDHLLHHVGRDRVEAHFNMLNETPHRSIPFLTTQEMFRIKIGTDRELAAHYAAASIEDRRKLLADGGRISASEPNMVMVSLWKAPIEIDTVEWFASAQECTAVMRDLAVHADRQEHEPLVDVLSTNPGVPIDPIIWKNTFYKGGSEPGVMNLTWMLMRADGRTFVLTMGFNDTERALNENKLIGLAMGAIKLLADVQ